MEFSNRVTDMLGVELPIVQAPMGWIARSQLASAVSNSGGLGIIETSSGELDAIRIEIQKMWELTDKPFGVNIAQAFVRDPDIVRFVIDQGQVCDDICGKSGAIHGRIESGWIDRFPRGPEPGGRQKSGILRG